MEILTENWLTIATGVVAFASLIARITPNTTDNEVVAFALKVIDFFAMSSTPTTLNKLKG